MKIKLNNAHSKYKNAFMDFGNQNIKKIGSALSHYSATQRRTKMTEMQLNPTFKKMNQ